jgi:hypothetical protein
VPHCYRASNFFTAILPASSPGRSPSYGSQSITGQSPQVSKCLEKAISSTNGKLRLPCHGKCLPWRRRLLFQVGLAPLNSSMTFRPHRPDHDVCRKRPITRWTLFHETPSPYFRPSGCQSTCLEPQAKLWASVCMHHSRRYHTGWLSFVQHRGFPTI